MSADPGRGRRRPLLELVLVAASVLLISRFVVTGVGIVGASMAPTLLPGDRALVARFESWWPHPGGAPFARGDVIVFRNPLSDGGGSRFVVKRIVAVAGETVELRDGALFVDDRPRPEPYVRNPVVARQTTEPVTVPPGHVFVLGDNRAPLASQDSRRYGPIALDTVFGRATLVLWPPLRRGDDGWHLNLHRVTGPS